MSLQTATLGWGIVSKNTGLYINIDYVGTLHIGMDLTDLNTMLSRYSQMALRVRHDDSNYRRVCYVNDAGDEVFSVLIIGNAIYRIRCDGIMNYIPQELVYNVGKRKFITCNRVDGYMLAIKGTNEIYLTETKSLQANDISSDSLGVVKKALTKKEAESNSDAWMGVFDTKNRYSTDMYKKTRAEVNALEDEYNKLLQKKRQLESKRATLMNIVDKRKQLSDIQKSVHNTESIYNEAKQSYTNIVTKYLEDIKRLISLGKLRRENGLILLNEDSDNTRNVKKSRMVPVYKEVEHSYEPEMLLHEDYDQYLRRRKRESSSYTERVLDGYREESYTKKVVDNDFIQAKEIVEQLEAPMQRYEKANKEFNDAKHNLDLAERKLSEYTKTQQYQNAVETLNSVNSELKEINEQVEKLKKQIYGN